MAKRVGIVNNGFCETIFDVETGGIIYQSFLQDETEDAYSYLDNSGHPYIVVSYSCY